MTTVYESPLNTQCTEMLDIKTGDKLQNVQSVYTHTPRGQVQRENGQKRGDSVGGSNGSDHTKIHTDFSINFPVSF